MCLTTRLYGNINFYTMVCIICFYVFVLIAFLKHDRYSSKVTKPINNLDVTYATFHWLKLVRPCVAQKWQPSFSSKRTIDSLRTNYLLLKIQVLRCLQKQIAPGCIDRNGSSFEKNANQP